MRQETLSRTVTLKAIFFLNEISARDKHVIVIVVEILAAIVSAPRKGRMPGSITQIELLPKPPAHVLLICHGLSTRCY
jgi:hypothetical protein